MSEVLSTEQTMNSWNEVPQSPLNSIPQMEAAWRNIWQSGVLTLVVAAGGELLRRVGNDMNKSDRTFVTRLSSVPVRLAGIGVLGGAVGMGLSTAVHLDEHVGDVRAQNEYDGYRRDELY